MKELLFPGVRGLCERGHGSTSILCGSYLMEEGVWLHCRWEWYVCK